MSVETFTPDNLIAGDGIVTETVYDLLSGVGALTRGTVLGQIKVAFSATAAGTNTGGGGISAGGLAAGGPAKVGVYNIKCIGTGTNGGIFSVTDPDGQSIGVAVVGTTFAQGGITFLLSDSGTDFAIGDSFTLTTVAGSLKLNKALLAATDGSNKIYGILADDCDSTSADQECTVYIAGQFNESALVFGTGLTIANTRDDARLKGIIYTETKNNAVVA